MVRAITISRTKTVLSLPKRVDEIHHLEFSAEEREGYTAANKETITLFEAAISGRQSGQTFNALSRLNYLRLFCNHGVLTDSRSVAANTLLIQTPSLEGAKVDEFYSKFLDGSATCAQCDEAILEGLLAGASTPDFDESSSSINTCRLCDGCRLKSVDRHSDIASPFRREDSSTCLTSSFPSTPRAQTQSNISIESMPTKIKALQADLSRYAPREKW